MCLKFLKTVTESFKRGVIVRITDIQKQKHNSKRYSVFVDGEFAFGLDEVDVLYYKLLNCDEISEEKFNYIKENVVFAKARDTAVKYLSFKARTEKEIVLKLREKEFSDDVIERVCELLKKYDYIDDYKYAGSFLRDKFNLKGFGANRIKFELKQRGVSSEIIEQVFLENEIDEAQKAAELIERKYGVFEFDIKEKRRIEGFLARKGFSFSIIGEAFDIIKEMLED